uniref:Uncharacterized protein n=1 Tax=Noctiluca scintillans TaxID=2966 RepID=A0A7S1AT31_NOCSC|mmetsp:Transcript_58899/g.156827  ORF Transcript_58899/g.156827 Transcript_58899/m.156827 type:complete len:232 (+) Transcript_58899:62-757(+)
MVLIRPAPTTLCGWSLQALVQMFCFLHLVTCVYFVCKTGGHETLEMGGLKISPVVRRANTTWFLFGLICVVIGGTGAVFQVKDQIMVYLYYLAASMVYAVGWTCLFMAEGTVCGTTAANQVAFLCGISNGVVMFGMILCVGALAVQSFIVWSMKETIEQRNMSDLLRCQEPWETAAMLADDYAQNEAKEYRRLMHHLPQQNPSHPTYPQTSQPSVSPVPMRAVSQTLRTLV